MLNSSSNNISVSSGRTWSRKPTRPGTRGRPPRWEPRPPAPRRLRRTAPTSGGGRCAVSRRRSACSRRCTLPSNTFFGRCVADVVINKCSANYIRTTVLNHFRRWYVLNIILIQNPWNYATFWKCPYWIWWNSGNTNAFLSYMLKGLRWIFLVLNVEILKIQSSCDRNLIYHINRIIVELENAEKFEAVSIYYHIL